ncbi:MAG: helix-turn-helix transcriptional regulator [Clostridia bacterium]|nr:helix-turn-helix transcriptional regulator [Clostridia bacterium]
MNNQTYEFHTYKNLELPIIFHQDTLKKNQLFYPHWHENIEILSVKDGKIAVNLDDSIATANKGDILVINSSVIHRISAISDIANYTCLIIDKSFCEQHGFYVDEKRICETIKDDILFDMIMNMRTVLKTKPLYYTEEVLTDIIKILICMFRNYIAEEELSGTSKNIEMVKRGIKYIRKHFKEQISIDDIASYAGYSKYHFCRCFKEITGSTVNTYINQVKIDYAYRQLSNTDTSISDIAFECGFNDISYFTKTFKKFALTLPSKVEKRKTKT